MNHLPVGRGTPTPTTLLHPYENVGVRAPRPTTEKSC
jgi:hypothetical protein